MARTVITDSGFWIGLLDDRDQYSAEAAAWHSIILRNLMVIPWPCVYEVMSTRMARRGDRIDRFAKVVRQEKVILLDDSPYREDALAECAASNREFSLADCVIRRMVSDPRVRKHDLITFNPDDFADVCFKHRVELLTGSPPQH